jgi:Uma2 family endonuclease
VEAMAAVEPHRFTVEEYERMGQVGILGKADRVELIDGQIVQMTPIGPPHNGTVITLTRLLLSAVGERAVVSAQGPTVLDDFSEPQPDFALLKPPEDAYRRRHPRPEDVLLLIEVADTSARFDRKVKLPLYAIAGIREYWIVDINQSAIEAYRSPAGDRYASVETLRSGDRIAPLTIPDVELSVSEILGTT